MTMKSADTEGLILPSFLENFEFLFSDEDYGFKAGDKLMALILASLRLENVCDSEQLICKTGILLEGIYFVHQGKVDVSYNPPAKLFCDHVSTRSQNGINSAAKRFLVHESGSYFGDISYIFKTRNYY